MDTNSNTNMAPQAPGQPSIADAVRPPKKSKVGLIIGIALGSFALIAIIATVILYFVWWQAPEHRLSRAVTSVITSEKSSGKTTLNISDGKTKGSLVVDATSNGGRSKAAIKLRPTPPELGQEIEITIEGIVDKDGTLYIKAKNINELLDAIINAAVKNILSSPSYQGQGIDEDTLRSELKKQLAEKIGPVVKKLDNQWLKLSANDLQGAGQSKQAKCLVDRIKAINDNKDLRRQIASAYNKASFLKVKKVTEKDGLTGMEIDIDSAQSETKRKEFMDTLSRLPVFSKDDCGSLDYKADSYKSKNSSDTQMVIWLKGDQMRKVEFQVGNKFSMTTEIEPGKATNIEVPSDASSIADIVGDLQESALRS